MRVVDKGRQELGRSLLERAAYHFSRAIEIDSTNPYAYFYLGLTRKQANKCGQASDLFARASDLFGEDRAWAAESLAYRGECLEKLGRTEEAKKTYEQALEVDRGNLRAQNGLSRN